MIEEIAIGLSEQREDGVTKVVAGQRVVDMLRTDHLNEKRSLLELCFDYQDVFYLPGDRLSSTSAFTHTITLESGVPQ